MTPEQYRDAVRRISAAAATQVNHLYAQYRAGQVSRDDFIATAVIWVGAARDQAAAVADVALAVTLTSILGREVAPVGVQAAEPTWLPDAFTKTLDMAGDAAYQVDVIAKNEPLIAASVARSDAMKSHKVGWTRIAHAGACSACQHLANGKVLSWRTTMFHHVGCTCVQQPITEESRQERV